MTTLKSQNNLTSNLIRMIGNRTAPRGKNQGRVCILNYHRVLDSVDPFLDSEPDVATFKWQMELLAECFNVMPLYDAVTTLGKERMPPRVVCITFDDGYRSIHDLALPILKEFSLPATVFVTSGYIDEGNMWNDRILEAVRRLNIGRLDLSESGLGVHSLEALADKKRAVDELMNNAKYLPSSERLDVAVKLERLTPVPIQPSLMLTRKMIFDLSEQGIEIGAHTITHPILTKIEDESARYEMTAGKRQLEHITGKPIRLFAYPNGKRGKDFDERHELMAQDAGFTAAFTTAVGAATEKDDIYRMPRSRPWDKTRTLFALRLLRWLAA
jgi:peptidoglycan/xylan/chitin deacetylase (PgdA/CDA1 family)